MADQITPIVVPGSSVPLQLQTVAQYIVTGISGYAVAHQWFGQDVAGQILAATPGVLALIYGAYRTWQSNTEKKTIINSPDTTVPASVASVKS